MSAATRMAAATRDPLLSAAKIVIVFVGAITAITGAGLLVGAAVLPFFQSEVMAELLKQGHAPPAGFFGGVSMLLVLIAGLLALFGYFLLLLWRIVATVGEGDPFVPQNADRLRLMGWVALAANILGATVGGLITWAASAAGDLTQNLEADNDFGFDAGGVVLILVLFILARVFRKGAEMRDELEGTV